MEFAGYGGHKGFSRLFLGVAPMLVAWPTLGMQPMMALAVQWLGFTGLWYADSKATMAGWSMSGFLLHRNSTTDGCSPIFSTQVVLTVSILSFNPGRNLVRFTSISLYCKPLDNKLRSIIGSLAGTSIFGPVAGHGFITHDLDHLREERRRTMPSKHGMIQGPIEAVPASDDEEHYTRIHKRDIKKEEQNKA